MSKNSSDKTVVIVVDDESSVLKLIKQRLETEDFQVVTSETGHQAIEAIQRLDGTQRAKILAVLLDLTLKDMSGFDVLKRIKHIEPSLPVIIVSGRHDESEAQEAISLGAVDYLTKPINFKNLTSVLNTLGSH